MAIVELALTPRHPERRTLLCGGPPTDADLAHAKTLGARAVLDLRPAAEGSASADAQRVAAAGFTPLRIAIAGAAGFTPDNVRAFALAVDDPAQVPLLVHCGTGNRVGALAALKAVWHDGLAADAAIALGRAAGLTKAEAAVRTALGLG